MIQLAQIPMPIPARHRPWVTAVVLLATGLLLAGAPARGAEEDAVPLFDPADTSAGAWAASPYAESSVWRGEAELGFLQTQGNDDTRQVQTRGRVQNDRPTWRHTGRAEYLRQEDNDDNVFEQYLALEKSAYKLSTFDYLFEQIKWERNRASGIRHRTSEVLGYGRRLVELTMVQLDAEIGAGARQTDPTTGDYVSEPIVVLALELNWDIAEGINFNQLMNVDAGEENTASEAITAITVGAVQNLSLRATYTVRNNTSVPEGVENTDTITTLTLVYSF